MCGGSDFIKKHKTALELAAAAAATAVTMGAASPALAAVAGSAAAADAGAAGAAGAGALGAGAAGAGAAGAADAGASALGTGAMDMTGSAGTGLLGSQAATPATNGFASGLLQSMGHMGPEQANILADQNAAFGISAPAANMQTLDAANPTVNSLVGQHGVVTRAGDALSQMSKGMQTAKAAGLFGAPQPPSNLQRPPSMTEQQPQQSSAQIMSGGGSLALPPTAGQSPTAGISPQMLQQLLAMLKQRGM